MPRSAAAGQIVSRVSRGHIVQHRVQRRPQLNPDQDAGVAFERHHRLPAAGQQQQQQRKQRVGDRLDHVAEYRQRLFGDLAVVDPRGVLLGGRLGTADSQHHRCRIVGPLPGQLAGIVDDVEDRVLADQVG